MKVTFPVVISSGGRHGESFDDEVTVDISDDEYKNLSSVNEKIIEQFKVDILNYVDDDAMLEEKAVALKKDVSDLTTEDIWSAFSETYLLRIEFKPNIV